MNFYNIRKESSTFMHSGWKRNVLSFIFRSVDKSRETRSEPIWFTFRGSAWCSQTWCWLSLEQRGTAAKIFVYTFRSFSCHYEHTATSTPSRRKIYKRKDSVNNDYPLGCFVFCDSSDCIVKCIILFYLLVKSTVFEQYVEYYIMRAFVICRGNNFLFWNGECRRGGGTQGTNERRMVGETT
jgi:hypothetical protein